jgi:polar amino acid transport system substrate-binding protein
MWREAIRGISSCGSRSLASWQSVCAAIAVLTVVLAGDASADDLQLLTHQLAPFTTTDSDEPQGFAVDLVNEIMGADARPTLTIVPFARLLADVEQGPHTAGFIIARTPEREAKMQWVGPLIVTGVYVYVKVKSDFRLETLDDLRKLDRIGVENRNADDQFLTERGFSNIERRSSQASALLGVAADRLSAAPMSELVFDRLVRELHLAPGDFRRVPVKLYDVRLYLGVSKDVPHDRVAIWSAKLQELKESGRVDFLLQRYGLSDNSSN